MVAQAMCPDPEVIHDLLCGELPEGEHGQLSSHLDLCADCRNRFDEAAAGPDYLGDVVRSCGTPQWQQETATLGRLMQDMPQQLSTAADAASIVTWSTQAVTEFFEPSDDPEHIGRLGAYEIIEVIGRGGMGIVLRGIDTKLNRVVAIKVLAPELASNPNARRRFFREGQAAAAVSHDHVVTIHAVDDSERLPYLVMEFIEGDSLEECVRRSGSLEVEQILRIGRQTALGLAAAHEVGLVHRDMKPANILLENGIQRVRITDFGLARAVDDVGITQTGTVTGTPLYMSPEQAGGENVDHRSDLFSLGSVLYTMCTGRAAFRANSTVAVLKRVCEDTPRPIREVNPDIPDWLADVIDRLISKQADDRFQSAAEVAELLGKHLAHLQDPENVPAPAGAATASESTRRSRSTRLLLLVVMLSIVTFGVTDAVGLTAVGETFMGIILKLTTPDGTLVVEIEDPNVEVRVDGDELVVAGIGPHEIRLRPGRHQATTVRNGLHAGQEWVTIKSGDRTMLRVQQLPPKPATEKISQSPAPATRKRRPVNDDDVEYRLAVDGIAFEPEMRQQRFGNQQVVVAPGIGKLIFPEIPEQLYGQRCAMAEVNGGRLRFRVQNRSFGGEFRFITDRQQLWLLVPEAGWGEEVSDDGIAYDTHESLAKQNWHAWRTLTSYHATTDPNDEENHVKWAVFYREAANEVISVRTHPNYTPMLVWGSVQLGGVVVDAQWDQRVSQFNPGASVSLGNGHHIFDKVPEFLAGRLYSKRNGYQGLAHFRVEDDQRVFVAMYDWRAMNDGNGGVWQEELTPPEVLKRTGWQEVTTLEPKHSHPSGKATWHVYARDCVRGDVFKLRSHKYQAPIVFGDRLVDLSPPAVEEVDAPRPTPTDVERRITDLEAEFTRLFNELRFAEALVIAKQAIELAPDNRECILMLQEAQQAVRGTGATLLGNKPVLTPATTNSETAIQLDTTGITIRIAPSVGETAVYGVGSPVTQIRDFPVYFEARANGRHPDGAQKLIGQIRGPVQPGDSIVVERFERAGHLLRLHFRREAGPRIRSESRANQSMGDINLLEEARRLTAVYERARAEHPNHKDVKHWLLLIARHLIARADMESDLNEVRKLREQARERVLQARKLFEADAGSAKAKLESFPESVDPKTSPDQHRQKTQAETSYITAQLQVTTCRMVDALSLRLFTEERDGRLRAVADDFETLYRKYRSRLGGLHARVEQARCLQFLGWPENALPILREVLSHPGNSESMLRLQNRALLFSLMSLNDEREDWNGVMSRVSEWLAKAPVEHQRSVAGAGILAEEARAMWGARETTPLRLIPELMSDDDGDLILLATLKLLHEVEALEGEHSALAGRRIRHVRALLDEGKEAAQAEMTGQSIYFQVPLPPLPTGNYEVQVTPGTVTTDDTQQPISGRFDVSDSNTTGTELRRLATQAIVLPVSTDTLGLTSATQSPHGLDLTAILESTDQAEFAESFSSDNAHFEEACATLRTKGMKWALCGILNHPNVDAKVYATRALARMADADTVAVLLAAAKRNDYDVSGSESATIHSIYRQALKKALEAATGMELTPDGLYYFTLDNGESTRFSSRTSPELFPDNVDFARVENWLRDVYLPNAETDVHPRVADLRESGLIGRVVVDGEDGGTMFHYPNGRFFVHEDIPPQIHDSNRFVVTLEGYLVVPQDMTVKVWHGGGGVSHDVNWLYLDDKKISVVGDDHSKHFVAEIPMLKGLHQVRWKLTGGTFQTNLLAFVDPESGELMDFANSGIASIRTSADEPVVRINGTEMDWPITDPDWLPPAVEVTPRKQLDDTGQPPADADALPGL